MILNYNQASTSNFKVEIPSCPQLEFYVTEANVPTMTLGGIELQYQNKRIKVPDNKFEWDEITLQFLVDEELYVYELLTDWCKKAQQESELWQASLKDINIIPLDSNKNIEYKISLEGAFPTMISGWQYTSGNSTTEYLTIDVTFAFQDLTLVREKPLSFSIV